MGSDICIFLEVAYRRDPKDPEAHLRPRLWEGTGELLGPGRDYERFAKLCGMRGDGPPPRGVPPSISHAVKEALDSWEGGAVSVSWATLDEWREVAAGSPRWTAVVAYAEAYMADGWYDAARIVYWFDN
jgi:hypothetical protein